MIPHLFGPCSQQFKDHGKTSFWHNTSSVWSMSRLLWQWQHSLCLKIIKQFVDGLPAQSVCSEWPLTWSVLFPKDRCTSGQYIAFLIITRARDSFFQFHIGILKTWLEKQSSLRRKRRFHPWLGVTKREAYCQQWSSALQILPSA